MPKTGETLSQSSFVGGRGPARSTIESVPSNGASKGESQGERGKTNASRSDQASQEDTLNRDTDHKGVRQMAQSVQSRILGNNSRTPTTGASGSVATPPQTDSTRSQINQHDMRILQSWSQGQLIDEIGKSWGRVQRRENKISSLEQALIAERRQNSELQDRLSSQDSDVRQAQESAFALMASSSSKAEDDDVICSKFKASRSRWKQFAKEWAAKDLPKTEEGITAIASRLSPNLVASDEGQSADGLWSKRHESKACALLLNAELGRFIGQEIVQRPFTTAFDHGTETDDYTNGDPTVMRNLDMLYGEFLRENPGTAHLWRSQTVRLLDQQEANSSSSGSSASQEARDRRMRYYCKIMQHFESSDAKYLYRQCDEQDKSKRWEQLLEIFRSTGELTSKLWSQKVFISVLGAKELLKQPFKVSSKEFEAHASHKLEGGDTSLDGMSIQLVVEPAIVAWGNEQGESYDTRKVWSEGVVWLSHGATSSTKAALAEANMVLAPNVSASGGKAD